MPVKSSCAIAGLTSIAASIASVLKRMCSYKNTIDLFRIRAAFARRKTQTPPDPRSDRQGRHRFGRRRQHAALAPRRYSRRKSIPVQHARRGRKRPAAAADSRVELDRPAEELNLLLHRQPRRIPGPPPAVERNRVLVAHLLQIIGHQRGSEPPAAIQHHGCRFVRNLRFNVPLDGALAQMDRALGMTFSPFVVFADVDQNMLVTHLLVLVDVHLFDARFGIVHQLQKAGTVVFVWDAHSLTLRMQAPAPASFDSIFSYPRSDRKSV